MKRYDSYKESGIDWIGEIPTNWNIKKLKFISKICNGQDQKAVLDDNGIYPVYGSGGIFGKANSYLFDKPSVLLGRKGTIDKPQYVEVPFWTVDTSYYTKIHDGFSVRLFYYLCTTINFELYKYGSAIPSMTQGHLNEIKFAIPETFDEQIILANYLDHKTTQIEHLIAKKEQFIQLLEEERVAVINQAVTKGLDPNVSMKDSGIEWLGKIPEHWESYRIDWVANIVRGNTGFRKDELLDSGDYVALQYGKTYKVDIVDNSFNFFVNSEFYKESQIVTKGDTILISTSETSEDLGHTCFYINENDGLLGGEQILLKPNRTVLNEKYLYQYVRQFCRELQKYAKGLKVFRFSTHDLKQIFIAIPTIEEQIKIVDFLDIETIRIDSLTSKMEKEIELLKEYKTALISEVVTGKVDVRNS